MEGLHHGDMKALRKTSMFFFFSGGFICYIYAVDMYIDLFLMYIYTHIYVIHSLMAQ